MDSPNSFEFPNCEAIRGVCLCKRLLLRQEFIDKQEWRPYLQSIHRNLSSAIEANNHRNRPKSIAPCSTPFAKLQFDFIAQMGFPRHTTGFETRPPSLNKTFCVREFLKTKIIPTLTIKLLQGERERKKQLNLHATLSH